jgi:acid phosphatase
MAATTRRFLYRGVGIVLLAASFASGYVGGERHLLSPGVSPQNPDAAPPGHELLDAALWQHTAAEYRAVCWQTYRLARENLDRALVNPSWTASPDQAGDFAKLPPAITMDIDETVLDSTDYEARVIRDYGEYTQESFHRWCEELRSGAVPGAKDFCQYAVQKGVKVFFTTNRSAEVQKAARANLDRLGFPLDPEVETVLAFDGTSLSERRQKVASRYRILLEMGDNLDDFVAGAKDTPERRQALAEKYRDYWGTRWIILPNAMYGFWEASLYGFDYKMPRADKLRMKMDALPK